MNRFGGIGLCKPEVTGSIPVRSITDLHGFPTPRAAERGRSLRNVSAVSAQQSFPIKTSSGP
jgi:hypothetical protein